MKTLILAVGRARPGPEKTLFDHYASRLRGGLAVVEVEEKRPLPVPARKEREAELLLAQVPPGAVLVALDEHGKAWSSLALARALEKWQDDSRPALAFAIGGADGHGTALLARADVVVSLGALTWPHMLVRALIAEQVYRAQCILGGHPYHRE
ncbi:23S rRNA (pseudouridine(1915)-N(3))-methyltransferase RlmH [Pararhodospirillum photometricum]|uniref:Ribosomal RNA large subunit methyltransferase H n=1 Tax=Pararhodospirillum photometricum DSM 122 TaxID=1150469 RepID=H6SKK7_PARPM|nr:23S rRNA (pseudouridine(1915)-N(3))-methyltransferase RlmH [Pararhodospirillum photometricum]CCG08522.1 Ribosomal RNA large subunit methyltransferase H [Pararhodospirillum photometricum DSM 122]